MVPARYAYLGVSGTLASAGRRAEVGQWPAAPAAISRPAGSCRNRAAVPDAHRHRPACLLRHCGTVRADGALPSLLAAPRACLSAPRRNSRAARHGRRTRMMHRAAPPSPWRGCPGMRLRLRCR